MILPDTRKIVDENGELERYSESMLSHRDRDTLWGYDYAVERALYELSESHFSASFNRCEITVYPSTEDYEDFIKGLEINRNDLVVSMIDGEDEDVFEKRYEERSKELKEIGIDEFKNKYMAASYEERFAYYLDVDNEEEDEE